MAKGKLILICRSGGEFEKNDDGTMSYKGGEANAVNVTSETQFNDVKLQMTEACDVDPKTVSIKYFLPGNKKNLIVVKNDKDVKRMIDFHGDAFTAEVFVMGTPGFGHNTADVGSNKKDEVEKRGRTRTKKDDKVPTNPPGKRIRRGRATVEEVSTDMSAGSSNETSSSDGDVAGEKANSDSGSDYKLRKSGSQRKSDSRREVDADTVKKRRRTPSWTFGPNGHPTIVLNSNHDSAGYKSRGKAENSTGRINSPRKSTRLSAKKDEVAKRGRTRTKKNDKVPTSPPGKRTRRGRATVEEVSTDMSAGSSNETSSSAGAGEKANSDSGSDYKLRRSGSQRKRDSRKEVVDASPADTVKKRRWTPSWTFGPNGRPTIVLNPNHDSAGYKSRGKAENSAGRINSPRQSTRLSAKGDNSGEKKLAGETSTVQVLDDEEQPGKESERVIYDDYAPSEAMVESWKSTITGVGQEFKNVNEFRAALKKYAIANRFGYKLKKNDTIRAIGGCAAEGCTWKFKALWVPTTQSFMIKSLHNVHTCDKESRKSAHPAKNWLVGTIKDRLRESRYLRPKELANGLLQDFGLELTYTQVWRGIGEAREQLYGSPIESYNNLPWFCKKLIKTNPGSIANLVLGENKRFISLFVCFYASIRGFQNGCRPLIFLEAVSFKSRYGEILLTATTLDGNDSFFPIAFAIVDTEDDATWHWFLKQLKLSISNLQPITFVVDRDKNLKKSVLAVFKNAYVGYSIHHLLTSFKRNMKGPFHGDGKGFLTVHFLAAAHAVRSVGFKKSIEQIKLIYSQAYDWVMEIEPENYATSSFKGERYNYITQDVGESYAFIMEDYRHLPISQKIDALIRTMIVGMEDAKRDASLWSTRLTSLKEKELDEEKVKARGLKVLISSDTLFEVREDSTHVVNIGNWSCTCMGWLKSGLPCRHALAVFLSIGKNPYDFCSSFFTADAYRLTYAESICPIPIDAAPYQNVLFSEKEKRKKQEGEIAEDKTEDGNKETLGKTEKEKGSNVDAEKDEGGHVDAKKGEGGNVDAEKEMSIIVYVEKEGGSKLDEGSSVDPEKGEGGIIDAKKDEGGNADAEKEMSIVVYVEKEGGSKLDVEKDEGSTVDPEKDEGSSVDAEKDEGGNADAEKDEGGNADAEKETRIIVYVEKEGGSKLDVDKDEGSSVDPEKDEGGNVDAKKDEGGNVDAEKEMGIIVYVEKEMGSKLDDKKDEDRKLDVEKDDSNVLVLPPIPAKQSCSSAAKKAMDTAETDRNIKRKITCKKCKQRGHYKKSCKTNV